MSVPKILSVGITSDSMKGSPIDELYTARRNPGELLVATSTSSPVFAERDIFVLFTFSSYLPSYLSMIGGKLSAKIISTK